MAATLLAFAFKKRNKKQYLLFFFSQGPLWTRAGNIFKGLKNSIPRSTTNSGGKCIKNSDTNSDKKPSDT